MLLRQVCTLLFAVNCVPSTVCPQLTLALCFCASAAWKEESAAGGPGAAAKGKGATRCPVPWHGSTCNECQLFDNPSMCGTGRCVHYCLPVSTWYCLPVSATVCPVVSTNTSTCCGTGRPSAGRVGAKQACRCEKCAKGWGGDLCDKCELSDKICEHDGEVDLATCKCHNCAPPWTGGMY